MINYEFNTEEAANEWFETEYKRALEKIKEAKTWNSKKELKKRENIWPKPNPQDDIDFKDRDNKEKGG